MSWADNWRPQTQHMCQPENVFYGLGMFLKLSFFLRRPFHHKLFGLLRSLVENDTILFRSCLSLGQDRTQPEFLLLLLYDSYQVILGTVLKYEWWLADTFKIWQRCQYRRKLYTYTHNFEESRRDLHSNHLGFNTNFLSVNWENILEKRCWFFASRKE